MDVIIVVGLVFLVFLWNPFNIFGGGLKLQNTANMVTDIKEIGELVTAEYYGEVIASDEEAELGLLQKDTIDILGERMYLELKSSIHSQYSYEMDLLQASTNAIRSEKKRRKQLEKGVLQIKSQVLTGLVDGDLLKRSFVSSKLYNEDLYHALILFLAKYEHNLDPKVKKFVRKEVKAKSGYIERKQLEVLSAEYENIVRFEADDPAFSGYLNQRFQSSSPFLDFYLEYMELMERRVEGRKESRKDLAIIGRGSVKAGFRFDRLNESNFVYDENTQSIHFYGFQAEILNQDINPWFIPERRVPGFQIVSQRNADFYQLKELKEHCVEKLVFNAKKAGIVEQAQQNGEEALKEFFSLLMGEEIRMVMFHQDPLIYQADGILKDSLIDYEELILLDTLISRNIRHIAKEKNQTVKARKQELLKKFITNLKSVHIAVEVNDTAYQFPFSYYNRHLPSLLLDSMISEEELEWIGSELRHDPACGDRIEYQPPPTAYQYWFETDLSYLNEFNQFITTLSSSPAKRGFYTRMERRDLDQMLPKDPDLYESHYAARDSVLALYPKLNYEYLGDTLRFSQFLTIKDPTYMKYLTKDNVNYKTSVQVDSVWQVFSLTNEIPLNMINLLQTNDQISKSSTDLDERLFANLPGTLVMDSTGVALSGDFGEYQGITFPEVADSVFDAVSSPALLREAFDLSQLRFFSFTKSVDSVNLLKISDSSWLVDKYGIENGSGSDTLQVSMGNGIQLGQHYFSEQVRDSLGTSAMSMIIYEHHAGNNWDLSRSLEVRVLRQYLLEQNLAYQAGPVIRLKRRFDNWVKTLRKNKDGISD